MDSRGFREWGGVRVGRISTFFFFFVSKGGRRMLALSSGLQWLESFENKPACLSKQQIVLSF